MNAPRVNLPGPAFARRGAAGAAKLALVGVVVVVTGVGLTLAVPKFLSARSPAADPPPVRATPPAPVDPPPPAHVDPAPAAAPQTKLIPTSADGDLVLDVKLRWQRVVTGSNLPATVRVGNGSTSPFQVPAAGEPHPTLALVVLDAEGHEVRRVVESGPDPYPRRTALVKPGESVELQALVLSSDDDPLPPGEYTVYAEMRRDPAWTRLGLPMWTAPKGAARSLQEPLTVVAPE